VSRGRGLESRVRASKSERDRAGAKETEQVQKQKGQSTSGRESRSRSKREEEQKWFKARVLKDPSVLFAAQLRHNYLANYGAITMQIPLVCRDYIHRVSAYLP
jgi:hypothetical protein